MGNEVKLYDYLTEKQQIRSDSNLILELAKDLYAELCVLTDTVDLGTLAKELTERGPRFEQLYETAGRTLQALDRFKRFHVNPEKMIDPLTWLLETRKDLRVVTSDDDAMFNLRSALQNLSINELPFKCLDLVKYNGKSFRFGRRLKNDLSNGIRHISVYYDLEKLKQSLMEVDVLATKCRALFFRVKEEIESVHPDLDEDQFDVVLIATIMSLKTHIDKCYLAIMTISFHREIESRGGERTEGERLNIDDLQDSFMSELISFKSSCSALKSETEDIVRPGADVIDRETLRAKMEDFDSDYGKMKMRSEPFFKEFLRSLDRAFANVIRKRN